MLALALSRNGLSFVRMSGHWVPENQWVSSFSGFGNKYFFKGAGHQLSAQPRTWRSRGSLFDLFGMGVPSKSFKTPSNMVLRVIGIRKPYHQAQIGDPNGTGKLILLRCNSIPLHNLFLSAYGVLKSNTILLKRTNRTQSNSNERTIAFDCSIYQSSSCPNVRLGFKQFN